MSMLRVPDGLTRDQKRFAGKFKKGAAKGQKKTTKKPGPRGKMPKGITTRKTKRKKRKR